MPTRPKVKREQLIATLAILKVNWDRGADYIENFVPFVAECLRTAPADAVALAEVRDSVLQRFGIRIPLGALKTILGRAAGHGYVRRVADVYTRVPSRLASLDFAPASESARRQHTALVKKLVSYTADHLPSPWSEDESEAALLAHLNTRSALVLSAILAEGTVPSRVAPDEVVDYIVSSFIVHLDDGDPEGLQYLETFVKGSMLASVLFYPDLGRVQSNFDNLWVYLDTRVVLRALGTEGPIHREVVTELLDLVYELGGRLAVFKDTVAEMRGVLYATKSALRSDPAAREPPGGAAEYLRSAGATPSDIDLLLARLDDDLRGLRIQLRDRPQHDAVLTVDETALHELLQARVGYRRENALQHDLDVLTAVHRLRKGEAQYRLETADAVFVTTNDRVASVARSFFGGTGDAIPIAFTDSQFVTLTWLKKPLRAPALPSKFVLADSYAGLNPSEALWRAYLEEIERLKERQDITDRDYFILRYSTVATNALMDVTSGDSGAFTEGTVKEVLARAQRATAAEAYAARAAAEERAARAEDSLLAERIQRQLSYQRIARFISRLVAQGLLWLIVLLAGFGTYLTLPRPIPQFPEEWLRLVGPAALLAVFMLGILSLASLWIGVTVQGMARTVENSLARRIESFLVAQFESDRAEAYVSDGPKVV